MERMLPNKSRVERHFVNQITLIRKILKTGRTDKFLISLMITEMYFRPFYFRVYEFLACKALFFFKIQRGYNLTIGLSQFRYVTWRQYMLEMGKKKINLNCIEDPIVNYDLLKITLGEGALNNNHFSHKIGIHVGETRTFYFNLVGYFISKIDLLMMRKKI